MLEYLAMKAKRSQISKSPDYSPDLKELDQVLDEESKVDKKLKKTMAAESYSHRKLHRELSKYDKKDAL
jgi:hypothetical protein